MRNTKKRTNGAKKHKTKHSKKDGWNTYALHHKETPAHPIVEQGLALIKPELEIPRVAVDLGCGPGGNILAIQANGFAVHGVDSNQLALNIAEKRIKKQEAQAKKLRIPLPQTKLHNTRMGSFKIPKCGLLVAIRSLGFETTENFNKLLKKIPQKIAPGGFAILHFFGPKDDWAKTGSVCALSKKEVLNALHAFKIKLIKEEYKTGKTVHGQLKNWHEIFVIAQKLP